MILSRFCGRQLLASVHVTTREARFLAKFRRRDTPPPQKDLKETELPHEGSASSPKDPIQPYSAEGIRENHPERPKYVNEYTDPFPKGKVYEKFPIKMPLETGKIYLWCTCGYSHIQPFCDGAHKTMEGTSVKKKVPKFRPHRFKVEENKDYYLCNCKQTDDRPFCDGSHKTLPDQILKMPGDEKGVK